jgi:glycosyltransferase involved in cell wall biosynthesis
MSATPLFSIVVPTYNRAHLISKTLQTILNQEFTDFEVLVVDDGSKDNTAEVVKQFSDTRIQYHSKANAERGAARNYGATRAKGAYINFFDSDDLMLPNHLITAQKMIAKENNPEVFHLGYEHRVDDGTLIGIHTTPGVNVRQTILFDNKLSCNGVFVRKDIAAQFPFEENRILASSEDWELWIRLVSRFDLPCAPEVTSTVVNHDHRSLTTIAAEKIVPRDLLMIELLQKDSTVMSAYQRSFSKFIAERYTFFMLKFSEQRDHREVFKWAWKAFTVYPLILMSKRFLASLKNSIR